MIYVVKALVGPNVHRRMDENPCIKCTTPLERDAVYCPSCGQQVGAEIEIIKESTFTKLAQQPQNFQSENIVHADKPSENYDKNPDIYQRPANYQFTKHVITRIVGTVKLDTHVVEEITDRPELQKEAMKLLLLNLTIVAIFQLMVIFTFDDKIYVESTVGTFTHIILTNFVSGFLYVYGIALIGKYLGASTSGIHYSTVVRVLSYGFVVSTIEWILVFMTALTRSNLVAYLWITSLLYYFVVFGFILRRTLGKSYIMSFAVLVTANILLFYLQRGIVELIDILFDGSFRLI